MARPLDHVPKCQFSQIESLLSSLYATHRSIKEVVTAGEFHQIWSCNVLVEGINQPAILRIAGPHIPRLKTENEAAILKWLRAKTSSAPIPDVLAFDAGTDNPLGHEYMLLERLPGVTGLDIHEQIPDDKMATILQQLAKLHLELFQKPFYHLGGLHLDESGASVPGPCVSEKLWFEPDVNRYWPASESYQSLNPCSSSGYPTYAEWIAAHMDCYIHGIKVHDSLSWITRSEMELLESFVRQLRDPKVIVRLGTLSFRLTHQDLHFGQLLIDPASYELTGIIDWEFSQVMPMPLWKKSFLWAGSTFAAKERRKQLYERWEEMVKAMDGGEEMLKAAEWPTEDHETVWDACNYLRCVVEVCPRDQQLDDARLWWKEVTRAIANFNSVDDESDE